VASYRRACLSQIGLSAYNVNDVVTPNSISVEGSRSSS
jgi:hypothetical protein